MRTNRRNVLKNSLAVAAAMVGSRLGLAPDLSFAQTYRSQSLENALKLGQRDLVIAGGAGGYLERVRKAFYDPFTAATGIKITAVSAPYGEKAARLKAMHEVNRVEWDIVTLSLDFLGPSVTPYLRDVGDCSAVPNVVRYGIEGACLRYGILFEVGGVPLVYDARALPAGRRQPRSWADFWNVKEFPGPRAMPNVGIPWWPLMAALQADGVPRQSLFPLDLDRAFRKMDEIKPHVAVWWRNGDQSQQIIRNREVMMSMMYSGRAFQLRSQGVPVNIVWDGAPIDAVFWAVTKNAPRPQAALAFLDYVFTRPEAHADYTRASFYDTSQKDALKLLSSEEQKAHATHPDNLRRLARVDRDWVAENRDRVTERWLKWLAS